MTGEFDIVFVGRTYRDTILHTGREPLHTVGGALMYGALAASRVGARVAVVTKMAPADRGLLAVLEDAGIVCRVAPASVTSEFDVIYPCEGSEHREIFQRREAEPFEPGDVPEFGARVVHLAGNAHGEFPVEFVRSMRRAGRLLSFDMQALVRQPGDGEHRIAFRDAAEKHEVAACVDILKLDKAEGELLTGEGDPVRAIEAVAGWGAAEVVLTHADGVLGRFRGRTVSERFTNRSLAGRNGRGDTTLAAYLARRLTHPPEDALRFAAALASIKLEAPGPFAGGLGDVLARMGEVKGIDSR